MPGLHLFRPVQGGLTGVAEEECPIRHPGYRAGHPRVAVDQAIPGDGRAGCGARREPTWRAVRAEQARPTATQNAVSPISWIGTPLLDMIDTAVWRPS